MLHVVPIALSVPPQHVVEVDAPGGEGLSSHINALRSGLEFRDAVKAHGAAAQVLKTLATSLRLTPQTRLRADATSARAANAPGGRRPWEVDEIERAYFA